MAIVGADAEEIRDLLRDMEIERNAVRATLRDVLVKAERQERVIAAVTALLDDPGDSFTHACCGLEDDDRSPGDPDCGACWARDLRAALGTD